MSKSNGLTFSKVSLRPPTITESFPSWSVITLPDTGDSTMSPPFSRIFPAISRLNAGLTVLISTNSFSGPEKLFVDISTVSPAFSREIAGKIREKGGDMVESPVSGSVITLQEGKLSVVVGGRQETFEKVKTLLLDIGPKVTHVGDNGLALVMKIGTNLSLAVQMLAFSEGVLLAEKSGIAREIAVDVLTHSVIASPMVQYRGPFVLSMPDEAWFNVTMMQKDLRLALEMGQRLSVPLPTTA